MLRHKGGFSLSASDLWLGAQWLMRVSSAPPILLGGVVPSTSPMLRLPSIWRPGRVVPAPWSLDPQV